MNVIKKLPQYLINKLKAWEIVERPASIVKELLENSLDAWADEIILNFSDWWKKLIKLEDNWIWIWVDDLNMSIERYATSKIKDENDLYNISSYWFRWEALASISEVSKFKIQTKIAKNNIWYELSKIWADVDIKNIVFGKNHWTIVYVEDLFFNTPVRLKFLKSAQTESNYIIDVFINFALINYDKKFVLIKDGKTYFNFDKKNDQLERVFDIYKKEWEKNLKIIGEVWEWISMYGIISDSMLSFQSLDNMKFFVNKRPVEDKIIKRSILESYSRHIPHWEYPFSLIFMELDPSKLDVNIHPRKIEVKFIDPWSVFNFIKKIIDNSFKDDKISNWYINKELSINNNNNRFDNINNIKYNTNNVKQNNSFDFSYNNNIYSSWNDKDVHIHRQNYDFKIIWQLWNSYIILETSGEVFLVDQHAIAERILFEKLRKNIKENWLKQEIIITPITISVPKSLDINERLEQLNNLWFDISIFWEWKVVIYAVPNVFQQYKLDIEKLIDKIIYMENITLDILMDNIFATKACKASIKAWEKLWFEQMEQLIKDWFDNIEGMFVCQHGRPSFVKIDKEDIEKLFDR